MNLYLIEQDTNETYDTYDSAIVVANNEAEAVAIHPSGNDSWKGDDEKYGSWTDKENVKAVLVGTTDIKKAGVLLASYNAG